MNKNIALLENSIERSANLGYNPPSDVDCLIRCVDHGAPSPLIRWHYHKDYEIHLVVASSGEFFVGDYIGNFRPGNLVLVGPNLPHNWISADVPPEGISLRDRCIVFNRAAIEKSSEVIPELNEVRLLFQRAACGIEFFGLSEIAFTYFDRIAKNQNITRLGIFFEFLGILNQCKDYKILSSFSSQEKKGAKSIVKIDSIIEYIGTHYADSISMPEVAKYFHMSESHFSRFFSQSTGSSFTEFLIRARITKAAQLLMQTEKNIFSICFESGFNNVANFNRHFLNIKGVTPSTFRLQSERRFG